MKRVVSILLILLLTILLLIGVVLFVLLTPSGQQLLTSQANKYLKRKLQTKIEVGYIRLQWPRSVSIGDLYLEDQKGDTLVAAERLHAGMNMWGLLRGKIAIEEVVLEGVRGKVSRRAPEKEFNYQFIVDAFSSETPQPEPTESSPLDMSWDKLTIKEVYLSYYDDAAGIDTDIRLPDAGVDFSAFNPSYSRYHPTDIRINGANLSLNMFHPEDLGLPEEVVTPTGDTLDLKLGGIDFRDVKLRYEDKVSRMTAEVTLPKLLASIDHVYLDGQNVAVKELALEGSRTMVLFDKLETGKTPDEVAPEAASEETQNNGWLVKLGDLRLLDNEVRYDDSNVKPVARGMDYSHLHITGFSGELADFIFSPDSTSGKLNNLQFAEKSGFRLDRLASDFAYTSTRAFLKNLVIQTPNTSIGDNLELQYANPEQLSDGLEKVRIELNLTNSKLGFKDVLLLAPDLAKTPPFEKQPNGFVQGKAHITGTVGDLQINEAVFTMPQATKLAVTGNVKGLPDPEKLAFKLDISEISSTKTDMLALIPSGTLPDSLELPESLALRGNIEGSLDDLKVDAELDSDMGRVLLSGDFLNMTDSLTASYDGKITLDGIQLGRILMQPADQLGVISLSADFSGTGLTTTGTTARLNGTIERADVLGYTYQGLVLSGSLDNGLADFKASLEDPNADIRLEGHADLNPEYPSINLQAGINNLDFHKLNLYSDSISLSGNFRLDFTSTDPANPQGVVNGEGIVVKDKGVSVPVGEMKVEMSNEAGEKRVLLQSAFADATVSGLFDYTELGTILAAETDRYMALSDTVVTVPEAPYRIDISGGFRHHDVLQVFAPGLTKMEPVRFSASLSNQRDTTSAFNVQAPLIEYDSTNVTGVSFAGAGDGDRFEYGGKVNEVVSGSLRVRNFSIEGEVADNLATSRLTVKDSIGRNQHLLGASVKKDEDDFVVALQNRMLLNYVPWRADTSGYVRYGKDGLLISDFSVYRNRSKEKLTINSVGDTEGAAPYPNGPIRIVADSIAIGPLVKMVTRDSTLAGGRLDGDINVKGYMGEKPVFHGNVSINSFQFQKVALGDFKLEAGNVASGVIDLNMTLKGEHNDIGLKGKYASGTERPLDFQLAMNSLGAGLIEAFSFGELRDGRGSLSGNMAIAGSTTSPELNGQLGFKGLAFHVSQMGARYAFKDGSISFDAPSMKLNKLTILDSLGQQLVIDGGIMLDRIPDVGYDLRITSDRFMLLNAGRKDNDLVYGKVFASANLSVKGRGAENKVDGAVKILKGSDATLILPDDNGGIDRGDGVVEFVQRGREEDQPEDTRESGVVVDFASELSLNIETDPEAEFTIVLDEMNGDNLRVRGNARLNTGLAPNGQLYLLGSYELEEGAYELTLEILKKQFEIRKGSQLIWSGDPMQAELDITAVYDVLADPSAFSPTNYAYGKVPFSVLLRISGNLTNPKIAFDLEVDEKAGSALKNKIDEEQILSSFRSDPSEMNKQVFGLLLLNKFMAETSNVSFGGFNAEAIARQSVSKMLTDQLNNLASDLIKGVQLDFNLNSTAGSAGGRTDLNVGLTKGFLNDRVTVSVGRNFELENSGQSAQSSEIFDNIAVNYKVTRDGRYLLRAYRKNQFQTVLEGFIIETGVSFIVTLDYNAVKEFWDR